MADAPVVVPNPIPGPRTSGTALAFVPKNFDDAWRQAEVLAKVSIFPDYLKNKPHEILATIITGAELGLSPMQSVRDIVVVKGKGFIQSKLKVALVKQACDTSRGEFFRMVKSDATSAVFETSRAGEGATKYEYTMEMAKLAGLHENDNYRKRPAEMLRARCSGDLAEIVWPDVTRGIGNKEDLPEYGSVEVNAAPATFAPPPPVQPEDAQVVPPSPPRTPKAAFEQAKTAEATGRTRLTIEDKPTAEPTREPGADEGEEHAPAEATSDLSLFAQVQLIDAVDPGATEALDKLTTEAKKIQGPGRQQLGDAIKAKREAIAAAKKAGK